MKRKQQPQQDAQTSGQKPRRRGRRAIGVIAVLIAIALLAVLASTLWLPILQIYSPSMEPTLQKGDTVILTKPKEYHTGDVMALQYKNKILVKRVVGCPGDLVRLDDDGTVYVNDVALEEPYLTEKAVGECDLTFPYEVPDGCYFVIGDNRVSSVDSRSSVVGCVEEEQILGRAIWRIWPLNRFSWIS